MNDVLDSYTPLHTQHMLRSISSIIVQINQITQMLKILLNNEFNYFSNLSLIDLNLK